MLNGGLNTTVDVTLHIGTLVYKDHSLWQICQINCPSVMMFALEKGPNFASLNAHYAPYFPSPPVTLVSRVAQEATTS